MWLHWFNGLPNRLGAACGTNKSCFFQLNVLMARCGTFHVRFLKMNRKDYLFAKNVLGPALFEHRGGADFD